MTRASAKKILPVLPVKRGGMEKYERVLDCAEKLLSEMPAGEIRMLDIASRTKLAPQTLYRMFPTTASVCLGLVRRHQERMEQGLEAALSRSIPTWQDAVRVHLATMREAYREKPEIMALVFGSGIFRDIRAADRKTIAGRTLPLLAYLEKEVSGLKTSGMRHHLDIAFEMNDAIWSFAFDLSRDIPDAFLEEGVRAVTAYLALYLPVYPSAFPVR